MKKIKFLAIVLIASLSSCAMLKAGDYATKAFMMEEDPALAAAALPTMIKATEAILLSNPGNAANALTTASLYTMYANAFLDSEAFLLPDEAFEAKQALTSRAKNLYGRASGLLVPIIVARVPGAFDADYRGDEKARASLSRFGRKDVPLLYWTAAAVLAGFADDPMDFDNAARIAGAIALFERARVLDPDWNGGQLHELAITIYGSMPADLGGDKEKAKEAFRTALAATGSTSPGPYVAYASSVCVSLGDAAAFKSSLETALSLPDRPDSALMDSLARRKAKRLLSDMPLYF